MIGYFGLFSAAFIAATFLPMQSEALLVALMLGNQHTLVILLLVATAGNVLGSVVNWVLGRVALQLKHKRWFPANDAQLARAEIWYHRYGRWSLLVSWFPVVGDALTIMAGVLREPLWSFVAIVTVGKAARYIALAMITLAWFPPSGG
ncbi:YqaA family protein [Sulfitobacter sp. CW3]|jgi:membrane protein YqaA with SNARE-associated domain|uniref:YqaA family protein n=1 Tax=Sulfitobacter sp. CW3 TaxID=2861965 RepID=UPI001C5DB7B3|nr:YqaA family protein [Sulfitobacter sp. CW3]MBW4960836.1 DedA family protein [Sulfitobacter sp. CW3]